MKKIFTIITIFITATSSFSQTLHLYGGKNHDVYLGCLNCDAYNSNSIWNEYGTYGSKYNSNSIPIARNYIPCPQINSQKHIFI